MARRQMIALVTTVVAIAGTIGLAAPASASASAASWQIGRAFGTSTSTTMTSNVATVAQGSTGGSPWVSLTAGPEFLKVTAPLGASFAAGQTWQTSLTGSFSTWLVYDGPNPCIDGTADVIVLASSFAADGVTLTSLAMDYDIVCHDAVGQPSWRRFSTGSLRWGSAVSTRTAVVGASFLPPSATPVTTTRDVQVPVDVLGSAPLHVTALSTAPGSNPDATLVSEDCSGKTLSGTNACTFSVHVAPAAVSATPRALQVVLTTPDVLGGVLPLSVVFAVRELPSAPVTRWFPTLTGPAIVWTASGDVGDTVALFRRPATGGPWSSVGSAFPMGGAGALDRTIDTTASVGAAYQYAARIVLAGGVAQSSLSVPLDVTRPALPAPTGGARLGWTTVLATGDPGGRGNTASGDMWGFSTSGSVHALSLTTPGALAPTVAVSLPTFSGTGTFTLTPADGVILAAGSSSCAAQAGTLTVRTAAYELTENPVLLDASLRGGCAADGSAPIQAEVRVGTNAPYALIRTSALSLAQVANPGADTVPSSWTVTNAGPDLAAVGNATLSGSDAASYTVTGGQALVLASGQSWSPSVVLHGAAVPTGVSAQLTASVASGPVSEGAVSAMLSGRTGAVPLAPIEVQADRFLGRTAIGFGRPLEDSARPVTGYLVERAPLGSTTWTALGTVLASGARNWLDDDNAADASFQYRVSAVNAVGTGPASGQVLPILATTVSVGTTPVADLGRQPAGLFFGLDSDRTVAIEDDYHDHRSAAVDPSGRWVVYSRSTTPGASSDYDLWVVGLDPGATPRQLTFTPSTAELDASVSPDGSTVAYTLYPLGSSVPQLWRVPASGGTPVKVAQGLSHPSWLSGTTMVAEDDRATAHGLVRVPLGGSPVTAIPGTAGGTQPTVSRDGTRIAYVDNSNQPRYVAVADWSIHAIDAPPGILSWGIFFDPTFDSFGHSVFARVRINDFARERGVALPDDGTAQDLPLEMSDGVPVDHDAPVVTLGVAAMFRGATGVPFGVQDAAGRGSTTTECQVDGGSWVGCSGVVPTVGLPSGGHAISVRATDPVGNSSTTSATVVIDATNPSLPTVTLGAYSLTTTANASFNATDDSGAVRFDIRWRYWSSGASAPAAYAYPATLQSRTTPNVTLSVPTNGSTCVSVRSRDAVGNVSAWTTDRCAARPVDSNAFKALDKGWTTLKSPGYYGGSADSTSRAGVRLQGLTSQDATGIAIVATRCRACGSVDVYLAGHKIGTASLASSVTANKVVISLPRFSRRHGVVVLRTRSARLVRIDGVVILH